MKGVEDPARAPNMSAGCLRSPAKAARPVFPSKSVLGNAEPLLDGKT
jgi:hypothetical protein